MVHDPKLPKLRCTVYLDDIAVFGDSIEEVLEATAEVIRRLARAGFMVNLKKSHLCEEALKILGHRWASGGYWLPQRERLEQLQEVSHEELRGVNRSSLYGLLNFFREYVPDFAERTEPLRKLLGNDAAPWTPEATKAVRDTVARVLSDVPWISFDPEAELRMEVKVSPGGLAAVLVQRDPQHKRRWLPVASWGRTLTTLDSRVLLEAKAAREALWKLQHYTAFARKLTLACGRELKALLKIAGKAHPML